jgi:hypothetical protein
MRVAVLGRAVQGWPPGEGVVVLRLPLTKAGSVCQPPRLETKIDSMIGEIENRQCLSCTGFGPDLALPLPRN